LASSKHGIYGELMTSAWIASVLRQDLKDLLEDVEDLEQDIWLLGRKTSQTRFSRYISISVYL